jgi:hypothetical protein
MAVMQTNHLTFPPDAWREVFRAVPTQPLNRNSPFYNAPARRNARGLEYSATAFSARQWRLKSQPRLSRKIRREVMRLTQIAIANFSLAIERAAWDAICVGSAGASGRDFPVLNVATGMSIVEDCMRV